MVADVARRVASSTVSLGISLSSCTIPGVGREDRVPQGKAELGLGIHGEPGVDLIDFMGAKQAAAILSEKLFASAAKVKGYALLLNNLGSTTPLEMGVLANEILGSPLGQKIKLIVGPGPLMTSLNMHGISASLLPLNPRFEKALVSPASPIAWPGANRPAKPAIKKLPKEIKPKPAKSSSNAALRNLVERACDLLIASEATLNALDARVGDGDTGSTMAGAARNLKSGINGMPLANNGDFFTAVSGTLSKTMGGSSGVLLAILFAAAGSSAAKGGTWALALQSGLRRMMEYGGAKPGDRTMVDALEPALSMLVSGKSVADAAKAARKGANATATMTRAKAGRSAYVSATNLQGIVDPGAEAVACLFEGLARS